MSLDAGQPDIAHELRLADTDDLPTIFRTWHRILPLQKSDMAVVRECFGHTRHWQARLAQVSNATAFARSTDDAIEIATAALRDESRYVRYYAGGLLAYSRRPDVIPDLTSFALVANPTERSWAETAIRVIRGARMRDFPRLAGWREPLPFLFPPDGGSVADDFHPPNWPWLADLGFEVEGLSHDYAHYRRGDIWLEARVQDHRDMNGALAFGLGRRYRLIEMKWYAWALDLEDDPLLAGLSMPIGGSAKAASRWLRELLPHILARYEVLSSRVEEAMRPPRFEDE
jgi:hypothetical protein